MSKFKVPSIQFDFKGGISAYDYQREAVTLAIDHMRDSTKPAYIYASVSAGKSLMIAIIANHFQRVNREAKLQGFNANHKVLMVVRTGDLVKQNADEAWNISCYNSIWCAGLGLKSAEFPCVMGSEKSIFNALNKELSSFSPTVVLIDEAHMLNYNDNDTQMMQIVSTLRERNKNLRVIGLTGSPWRGRDRMIDSDFWGGRELIAIDRNYLTERGYVMPVEFGFGVGDTHYESTIENYNPDEYGDCDLTKSQMDELEEKILSEGTKTQKIMLDVMRAMETRNVALITLSGLKHCKEAAKYLPKGSYAIVDQNTPTKERIKIKEKCNNGELKYVLQIGAWTVGVSIPRFDTIVIMRLIGSMTLYEQLVGRGVRLLKQADIDAGIIKNECLVLDYTDTSAIMAQLFSSDELDKAEESRARANDEDLITCPSCGHGNSLRARRCSGVSNTGARCEFFFSFKTCEEMRDPVTNRTIKNGCGTKNDPAAKTCRECGGYMVNPNEKLIGQAYDAADLIPVTKFNFGLTKAKDQVLVTYKLANGKSAREMFKVSSKEKWIRASWYEFLKSHCVSKIAIQQLRNCYSAEIAMQFAEDIKAPTHVTHRVNGKGFDLISRKVFDDA